MLFGVSRSSHNPLAWKAWLFLCWFALSAPKMSTLDAIRKIRALACAV